MRSKPFLTIAVFQLKCVSTIAEGALRPFEFSNCCRDVVVVLGGSLGHVVPTCGLVAFGIAIGLPVERRELKLQRGSTLSLDRLTEMVLRQIKLTDRVLRNGNTGVLHFLTTAVVQLERVLARFNWNHLCTRTQNLFATA